MTAILHSQRLWELVTARLAEHHADDVAGIVLGPRVRDLCAALGVPVRDWWQVSHWMDQRDHDHHHTEGHHHTDVLGAYIDVMVADRCVRPGDDLVSDLVAFDVDDCGLTADDIRTIIVELISA